MPIDDAYSVGAGGVIYGGISHAAPESSGGTVIQYLEDFSGSGFAHLSTVPSSPTFTKHHHAGACYDQVRRIMWLFGAETHNSTSGFVNSMYRWDAVTGLVSRMYAPDTWPGDYRVGTDGILYADSGYQRPWAMHAYNRVRYIPETEEVEVIYWGNEHAYWNTLRVDDLSKPQSSSLAPLWYFNTVTGAWRHSEEGDTSAFVKSEPFEGTCYVPGEGWFVLGNSNGYKLSEAGVRTQYNVFSVVNTHYHSNLFARGNELIKFGGNSNTYLYSKHLISNPASGSRYLQSSYSALSGWDTSNNWAVLMPDDRILFCAQDASKNMAAFILDVDANTVTDTGHRYGPQDQGVVWYNFRAVWDETAECAIFPDYRYNTVRIMACRP